MANSDEARGVHGEKGVYSAGECKEIAPISSFCCSN